MKTQLEKITSITLEKKDGKLYYGGYLYLEGTQITQLQAQKVNRKITIHNLTWQDCKYIKVDGIFSEVLSNRGNVYKIKGIGSDKIYWVVVKGNYSAHGDTLRQAKEDLQFKIIAEKLKNEPIKADTIIDLKYYRLITGACETGCNQWIEQNNITKQEFRADELLPLLRKHNAYGLDRFKKLITF